MFEDCKTKNIYDELEMLIPPFIGHQIFAVVCSIGFARIQRRNCLNYGNYIMGYGLLDIDDVVLVVVVVDFKTICSVHIFHVIPTLANTEQRRYRTSLSPLAVVVGVFIRPIFVTQDNVSKRWSFVFVLFFQKL